MIARIIILSLCFYLIGSTTIVRRPCKKYERYNECLPYCVVTRCSQLNNPPMCIPEHDKCSAGCECIPGYLYNDLGLCIPEKQCPRIRKNEEYVDVLPYCTVTKCSQISNPPVCVPEHEARAGWQCLPGHLLDDKENCIRKEKCKVNCPRGEVYNPSASGCEPTCSQTPTDCPIKDQPLCVCPKHQYRNSQWKCVTWDQCTESEIGGGGDLTGVPEGNYGCGDPNAEPEGTDDD